ncbi:hypothetical protein C789_4729 [Microcystis aeruginosa FACHB-905 = DIANCHI905]|nr:hypothetical protein C789_4729 [Microcystis aeruginosa FACHB-905 = DIANCHI905]
MIKAGIPSLSASWCGTGFSGSTTYRSRYLISTISSFPKALTYFSKVEIPTDSTFSSRLKTVALSQFNLRANSY